MTQTTPEQVASQVFEVVPGVMRSLRAQMREAREGDLSVTQFRVLGFIDRHKGTSLSDVADHIGLSLPSMSKIVDGLVTQRLVGREFDRADRRRMTLTLTPRGRSVLEAARAETRTAVAKSLGGLTPDELATVGAAMEILRPLFFTERETERKRREAYGSTGN